MLEAFASGFLVFAYLATALFLIAIVFGARLTQIPLSGEGGGAPSCTYRFLSALASLGMLAISGHYAAQLGIFKPLLDTELNALANWGFAGLAFLVAVATSFSETKKKRSFWAPIAISMFFTGLVIAI